MFKTVIYLYLEQAIPTISSKEMRFITTVLEHLDDWISEEMNTDEYYIRGVMHYRAGDDIRSTYYD